MKSYIPGGLIADMKPYMPGGLMADTESYIPDGFAADTEFCVCRHRIQCAYSKCSPACPA